MRLNRFHLAGSIVVVAALAVAVAMLSQPPTGEAPASPATSTQQSSPFDPAATNVASPTAVKEGTIAIVQPAPATGTAVSARLQAELSNARDWRTFALNAEQRPDEGGYYYAKYIADLCSRNMAALNAAAQASVASAVQATGTVEPNRLKVVEEFSSRCASFIPGEASQISRDVAARQADGRDPLVLAERRVLKLTAPSSDPALLKEAAATLLATLDPLVWSQYQLLYHLMAADPQARKAGGGMFFDGKTYAADDDGAGELAVAVRLAACVDNARCALDDTMVVTCIAGRHCAADRRTYVRTEYLESGGTAEGFARVLALEERVRAAALARSVRSFVR